MKSALLSIVLAAMTSVSAHAAPVVYDSYFRPDVPYPEFAKYWGFQRGGAFFSSGDMGGTMQMYIRNTGKQSITIDDAFLNGVSLTKAVAFFEARKYRRFIFPANIRFSKLPRKDIAVVTKVGEPVWWRFEPKTLKPGEIGELVVRVRRRSSWGSAELVATFRGTSAWAKALVSTVKRVPQLEAICFSPERDLVYVYAKHPRPGIRPWKLLVDGVDVTKNAVIASDPGLAVAPIVYKPAKPLDLASLHNFQVRYHSGDKVTASVRAYDGEFAYGMWGAAEGEAQQADIARAYLKGLAAHNINVQMEQVGSAAVADFMKTDEGLGMLDSLGIERMISEPDKGRIKTPWAFFLADEPDAGDSKIESLPAPAQIGSLGQGLVQRAAELRVTHPTVPSLLNLDYTFPPDNWYTYGQIADIMTADPYYQGSIAQETEWGKYPERLSLFRKPTYINGIAEICRSAQAPRQTNMLLFTGRPDAGDIKFRYATPQEKRIEVFYCIGAGIKGISYWWYHCLEDGLLPATSDPVAKAQWKEIGLLGALLRTAGPVIMTSCPVAARVSAPSDLWVRCLMRGTDTLVVLCVNDAYTCGTRGINIEALANVQVGVGLPGWLVPKGVFELTPEGTQDVKWALSGRRATLSPGSIEVARMFLITSDHELRGRLQKLYLDKFAARVAALMGEEN